jgi:hypothetical protein
LLPVTTTSSNSTRTIVRIGIPLLHFASPLNLYSLGLGTPTTSTWVVVLAVFVSYLTAALASSKLSAFFVAKVEIATNYPFV